MGSHQAAEASPSRQVAAIAALVLGAAAVVGSAVGAVGDGARVVLVPAVVVAIVLGGWLDVLRTGRARRVGLGVAVLGVVGLVALTATGEPDGPALWIPLALAALSVAAASHAIRHTVEVLRDAPTPGTPVPAARRPVLIVNEASGDGKAEEVSLADACAERGIEVVVLQPGDDLLELARTALADGADVIGMAGGDGSQALVASVAAEADVPMVCIPAGTRNHFAADLGLDRDEVVGALDAFGVAVERRVDLAEVNGHVFVNNVSLGIYARAVQDPDYRDAKAQTVARLLPDVFGTDAEPFDLCFVDGDGVERTGAQVIQVSNNPYDLAQIGAFGYRPRIDTGELGVAAAGIPEVSGWSGWSVAELEVRSSGPVEAGVDGEAEVLDPPLRFRSRPGALRVRLPSHAYGYSPARRRSHNIRTAFPDLVAVARGRSVPGLVHRS